MKKIDKYYCTKSFIFNPVSLWQKIEKEPLIYNGDELNANMQNKEKQS